MNTRTSVAVLAAAFLSAGLVSASSAQNNLSVTQDGIEVITIIGKRLAPATPVVSGVVTSADAAVKPQSGDGNSGNAVLEPNRTEVTGAKHSRKRRIEQSASAAEAQI